MQDFVRSDFSERLGFWRIFLGQNFSDETRLEGIRGKGNFEGISQPTTFRFGKTKHVFLVFFCSFLLDVGKAIPIFSPNMQRAVFAVLATYSFQTLFT